MYQQRPAPEEGNYFKKAWWRWYETAPPLDTLRIIGASDYRRRWRLRDPVAHNLECAAGLYFGTWMRVVC
jgi:hypothetical protein